MQNTSAYIGIDSWVDRLNPLTKVTFVVVICYLSFISPNYILPLFLYLLVFPIAAAGKVLKLYLNFALKYLTIILLMLFLIHGLFNPSNATVVFQFYFIRFYQEGLLFALNIASRLLVLLSIFYLFTITTKPSKMMSALVGAGLSSKIGYLVLATLNVVPQMQRRVAIIREAQQSRGVEIAGKLMVRIKALIPLVGPLVMGSLVDLQERGMTLEIRGFGSSHKPTQYVETFDTRGQKVSRRIMFWIAIITTIIIVLRKGIDIYRSLLHG